MVLFHLFAFSHLLLTATRPSIHIVSVPGKGHAVTLPPDGGVVGQSRVLSIPTELLDYHPFDI